jgi:hypothetical protein
MTRSRTSINPNEFTTISFPLKALKLILKDVQHVQTSSKPSMGGAKAADLGIDEDDGVSPFQQVISQHSFPRLPAVKPTLTAK